MKLSQALAGFALGAGLIFTSVAASAQDDAKAAPGTKAFGEWRVSCSSAPSPIPCAMQELLSRKGATQAEPILAIVIGYDTITKHSVAKIGVPLGVTLGKGLVISTDSYKSPPIRFHDCSRYFCFVQTGIPDATIAALSSASMGKITFTMEADGKTYSIGFPLKGFGEAHDAIVQGSNGKGAKSAPAAPADQPAQ